MVYIILFGVSVFIYKYFVSRQELCHSEQSEEFGMNYEPRTGVEKTGIITSYAVNVASCAMCLDG